MHKFKKVVAIALTTTMVFGSSLVALADETNTGNSTGAGTSEGHVDKKATNVVLPTIASGTTPFAYTMDPERLITETSHAKYGDAVEFPATGDTGVYFNNGKKGGDGTDKDNVVYKNTSAAQTVTNKSSHAISLTVKAEATTATTDIPLVAKNAVASADAASLYLGLIVGSEDPVAISGTTAATKTVTIAGTAGNFKTAVESNAYVYRALTEAEWKEAGDDARKALTGADLTAAYDATWAKTTFQLEGSVTSGKEIASTTTAPTVKVTWSWVDPSANTAPAKASVPATVTIPATGDITVSVTLGADEKDLSKLEVSAYEGDMLTMGNGYGATYSNKVVTMGSDIASYLRGASADDLNGVTFTATFGTGDDAYTQTFKFVAAE